MRKILYISGSRADYGLMANTLREIQKAGMEVEIAVTGMHIMPKFGSTIKEIRKDGFRIHKINVRYDADDKKASAEFIGKFTYALAKKMPDIEPDIVLLMGDRAEQMGAALVGSYMNIATAHVHGGDISLPVDGIVRHAITKLANMHFPATWKSASRLVDMGEEWSRIHMVGSPAIDNITKRTKPSFVVDKYKIECEKPLAIVVQHPTTYEAGQAEEQMHSTMQAITELGLQSIVIYPNADASGRKMIKVIEKYRKYPNIRIFKSMPRPDYLGLLHIADVLIGNSSSGIIDSPSFRIPVIDIGTRQKNRERAGNVMHCSYRKIQIKSCIKKAIGDKAFIQKAMNCINPYGNGNAGKQIAKILKNVNIDRNLLEKKLAV